MLALVLAAVPFLNINPSWSPDGKKLVFESRRHGAAEIYVVNVNGGGLRRLTHNEADDTHPAWSPDGGEILFDSNRDGTWNLYTIRPDGAGEQRLTNPGDAKTSAFARHPSWSPDGLSIAFDSDRDGNEEVYRMQRDGSGLRRLTRSPGRDGHPSWTRGDCAVVFGSDRSGTPDIWWTMPQAADDGTAPIVSGPGVQGGGKVSPDGSRLAYFAGDPPDIYVAGIEGNPPAAVGPVNVTRSDATEYEMSWSPDGSEIAFYSDRTGPFEIYVMAADGTRVRQVTKTRIP